MRRKNILVISKYFAPMNGIASLRWSKILKYLDRKGEYSFKVIAWEILDGDIEDPILVDDIKNSENIDVIHVKDIYKSCSTVLINVYHSILKKRGEYGKHEMLGYTPYCKSSLKTKIKLNIKYIRYLHFEKRFANKAYKILKYSKDIPDVIISTYGDFGDILLALKLKKKHPEIKLIVDYRDPVIRYFWPPIFNPFLKWLINQVSTYAEMIIGVTPECIDTHAHPEKNIIIPNGYDIEDRRFYKNNKSDNKLHICLTGTVYVNRRDQFFVLYDVLKQLNDEGKIDLSNIVIDYAGKYSTYVFQQAKKYGMESYVRNHGYIERSKALELQNSADILLVLSCNNMGESGVLTGKFLEYMMTGKYILAIISGNLENSIIHQLIEEGNLGFCYEEVTQEEDFKKLKKFLQEKYDEYIMMGHLTTNYNQKIIERFEYNNIADRVDDILRSIFNG